MKLKSFTLIELLVVIAICMILGALILGGVSSRSRHIVTSNGIIYNIGDTVCIPSLRLTGIVNSVQHTLGTPYSYLNLLTPTGYVSNVNASIVQKVELLER